MKSRFKVAEQIFQAGKFPLSIIDIDGKGKMTLSLNGGVIVISNYQIRGDLLEIEDIEGNRADPEYGAGRYQWQYDGLKITFKLLGDKIPIRRKAFAVPWCKVDSPELPYFFEGNP